MKGLQILIQTQGFDSRSNPEQPQPSCRTHTFGSDPSAPCGSVVERLFTYTRLVLEKGFIVTAGRKAFVTVLVLIGLILIAIGIVYFLVKAGSLPSMMGRIAGSSAHRNKRGLVAVIVGVVVLLVATVSASVGRRN